MAMIGYVARVLTGVRFKKMNHMIDVVHQKCGQNKVRTFFDMLWCAVRYGAGYYDYTMFGFYDMTGAQRDTYLTRVRNKKVSNIMNDMAHDDDFDDKLLFNVRFAKYLRRPTLNGETATPEQMSQFLEGQEAIFAKINHGSCGNGVEKLYVKDFASPEAMLDYIREKKLVVLEHVQARYGAPASPVREHHAHLHRPGGRPGAHRLHHPENGPGRRRVRQLRPGRHTLSGGYRHRKNLLPRHRRLFQRL